LATGSRKAATKNIEKDVFIAILVLEYCASAYIAMHWCGVMERFGPIGFTILIRLWRFMESSGIRYQIIIWSWNIILSRKFFFIEFITPQDPIQGTKVFGLG